MVSAIRESVEAVELEILSRIPDEALEQATETLRTLKETLLEILGGERGGRARTPTSKHVA